MSRIMKSGMMVVALVALLALAGLATAGDLGKGESKGPGGGNGGPVAIPQEDLDIAKKAVETAMKILNLDATVAFRDANENGVLDLMAEYTGRSKTEFKYLMTRSGLIGAVNSLKIKDRLDRVYLRFDGKDSYASIKELSACDEKKGSSEKSACWDAAWHKVE